MCVFKPINLLERKKKYNVDKICLQVVAYHATQQICSYVRTRLMTLLSLNNSQPNSSTYDHSNLATTVNQREAYLCRTNTKSSSTGTRDPGATCRVCLR